MENGIPAWHGLDFCQANRFALNEDALSELVTSPTASGPAGPLFQGQVGAHYLLTMLANAEPRGLPGTSIERIEFERASEGRALDDVTVIARDRQGQQAILEIQVKHAITFAPSDPVFRKVVAQIAEAAAHPDFKTSRYELAIATSRSSWKIDGAYQDVLSWARKLQSAKLFMARVRRPGLANKDMRTFVDTFCENLKFANAAHDDDTVWTLLRRLQILVFDFAAEGSASETLAKERAARVLSPDDAHRVLDLWSVLTELALDYAASGGELDRPALSQELTTKHTYRLAPDRKHARVRDLIDEASQNALRDIVDSIGDICIARDKLIEVIRSRFDTGCYLEIRGDGGVGKSSLLKHFAELVGAESRVLVLSSKRTPPNGWMTLRSILGFEGTARDLLADLATDGAAFLFIDALDDFTEEANRKTVIDLVAAAADVPNIHVVVTARNSFGRDEPNWLAKNTLQKLGIASPVIIDQLNNSEVDDLREADPRLAELLADTHPARELARNLYRLARLVSREGDGATPRTEVEMAEQWWLTADGHYDANHRERARLLRVLAERALDTPAPWNVADQPAIPIDQLRASETIRDFGNDRVAFRHDVLRDWAIASLLHSDIDYVRKLPLSRPAPAGLARGVELAARMAVERSTDDRRWQLLLEIVSAKEAHGSWRRAVLLALVRSEISHQLLQRTSNLLLSDRAKLFGELIRLAMAVDAEPARSLWAAAGLQPEQVPEHITVPRGPAWQHLIAWSLQLGERLPHAVLPDLVDLYCAWSTGLLGLDPLTPLLLERLLTWLQAIEVARENGPLWGENAPFGNEVAHDKLRDLEEQLRTSFLLFCNKSPPLAARYLSSILQRRDKVRIAASILTFRGSAAQAAPRQLVDVTLAALIPEQTSKKTRRPDPLDDGFTYADHKLMPASPTQGPFFELLSHNPQEGLRLIWALIGHAIAFATRRQEPGTDSITIDLPDGQRTFPWVDTYHWSRGNARSYSVSSALMALEAWAHQRIEAKEPVAAVLKDILGPPGTPAAVLLVAVDVLISHWPATLEEALPFLACPELLSIEHTRPMHDRLNSTDNPLVAALRSDEPPGSTKLRDLRQRPSRNYSLGDLLGTLTADGQEHLRSTITSRLQSARQRLGVFDTAATLADPAFMAYHAENLINPTNWHETEIETSPGNRKKVRQYKSPQQEQEHLDALQATRAGQGIHLSIELLLSARLRDGRKLSSSEIASAIKHVKELSASSDEDTITPRTSLCIMAAALAMRDGDAAIRVEHAAWASSVFKDAMGADPDAAHRYRSGLMFNPKAIAVVGLAALWTASPNDADCRSLLKAAADDVAVTHGFAAVAQSLANTDERIIRSILRCGLAACIRAVPHYETDAARLTEVRAQLKQQLDAQIAGELAWLAGSSTEPVWPEFPNEVRYRRRRGLRLPGGPPDDTPPAPTPQPPETFVDHQAGALWLNALVDPKVAHGRLLVGEIVESYAAWTMTLNGAGLDRDEELSETPHQWNDAFFRLAANSLPLIGMHKAESLVLKPICALPDEPFFNVLNDFLRDVDVLYFNDHAVSDEDAALIRTTLAERLMASRGWRRLSQQISYSIETHIAPAIAVLFMNDYGLGRPPSCYLFPKAAQQLAPFLPLLTELATKGAPSLFVALLTMNVLEVNPQPAHTPLALNVAAAWIEKHAAEVKFWIDNGIGKRWIAWLEKIQASEPDLFRAETDYRQQLDTILDGLVRAGLTPARRLEEKLAAQR